MYYEPNIATAPAQRKSIAKISLISGLLSLILWSVIIAIAASFIGR